MYTFVIHIDSVFWGFWGSMRTYCSSFFFVFGRSSNQSIKQPTNESTSHAISQLSSGLLFLGQARLGGAAAHLKADKQTGMHADTQDMQTGKTDRQEARRAARQTENADRQDGQTG